MDLIVSVHVYVMEPHILRWPWLWPLTYLMKNGKKTAYSMSDIHSMIFVYLMTQMSLVDRWPLTYLMKNGTKPVFSMSYTHTQHVYLMDLHLLRWPWSRPLTYLMKNGTKSAFSMPDI